MKKKSPKKQDLVDTYLLLDTIELALFALGLNLKLLHGEKLTKKKLKVLNRVVDKGEKMTESESHKKAKNKAAGKKRETEAPLPGGGRLDAKTEKTATEKAN